MQKKNSYFKFDVFSKQNDSLINAPKVNPYKQKC